MGGAQCECVQTMYCGNLGHFRILVLGDKSIIPPWPWPRAENREMAGGAMKQKNQR